MKIVSTCVYKKQCKPVHISDSTNITMLVTTAYIIL